MRAVFYLVAASLYLQVALGAQAKYPGFDLSLHDEPTVKFHLSDSDASSSSPVVISVSGRQLTNEDRRYRVDLQKEWLFHYVSRKLSLVDRVLAHCDYKRKGEYSYCDVYTFEDPATHQEAKYYIYVGNWP